ncbi:hypothetical protein OAS39_04575 [Pirellulales bacterium]|nr:hypothetical protein [Pirellulales bacterium]
MKYNFQRWQNVSPYQAPNQALFKERVSILAGILVVLTGAFNSVANAENPITIKTLEFEAGGILPSTEPDIEYSSQPRINEGAVFSVSDGTLQQQSFGSIGERSYNFPNTSISGGRLDPSLATIIEARVQVLRIQSGPPENRGGVFFQAFDGSHRYSVFFTPEGIDVRTPTGFDFVPVDVFQMHTYRLESPGESDELRVIVDGDVVHVTKAPKYRTLNGFNFGDAFHTSKSNNNANAKWEFVRVFQGVPLAKLSEVDAPSEQDMTLLGLLADWQYPNSKLNGATIGDGGVAGVTSIKCDAVLTTPDSVEKVINFYANRLEAAKTETSDARSVSAQDDSNDRPVTVRVFVVNAAKRSTTLVVTRAEGEHKTHIAWTHYRQLTP